MLLDGKDIPKLQPPADQTARHPIMAPTAVMTPMYCERKRTLVVNSLSLMLRGGSCMMPCSGGSRLSAKDGMTSMPRLIAKNCPRKEQCRPLPEQRPFLKVP